MSDETNRRHRLQHKILRYLLDHPTAADSAEGVRHWWLRDMGELSGAMTTDALEELLGRGLLVSRGDPPETRIYSLNEQMKESAVRFITNSILNESGDRSNG